jgi:phage internal scaffolding protein
MSFPRETRTHQSFKDECDINAIVKKAISTGRLPELIKENPRYGDFSSPLSYHEAMNVVALANEQFAALPASTRSRFLNDPENFLAFTADPENLPEMVKMGLAIKVKNDDSNDAQTQPQGQQTTTQTSQEPA